MYFDEHDDEGMMRVMIRHKYRGLVEHLNRISTLEKKKYTESVVKSQNIVEQANSNPNNISPTMSRRHIICKSSSVAEMNHKFHS